MIERIRIRAHQLWEGEGRPHGRDEIHWLQAESEVRAALSEPAAPSSSKKPGRKRTQPRTGRV
jgi:hypothetical protein